MTQEKALVVVALRADHADDVQRRLAVILAAVGTHDRPPETEACVFARALSEVTTDDLAHLEHFMGRRAVERLSVGLDPA